MLKLIDKSSWAAPLTIFATHLNAPCSSILLAQSQAQRIYLVVGKINGEVRFRYFQNKKIRLPRLCSSRWIDRSLLASLR